MGLVTVRDLSPLSPFRAQHFPVAQLLNPGKTLTQDIDELRLRALSILSPQQQHLGRVLLEIQDLNGERNILHHPRPDRSTALDRMRTLLNDGAFQTLREYLETDPKRLLSRRERTSHTDVDRYLFEAEGKCCVATRRSRQPQGRASGYTGVLGGARSGVMDGLSLILSFIYLHKSPRRQAVISL